MTQATPIYTADAEQLRCCKDCMIAGNPIWLPESRMHKRVKNGRVCWYCTKHVEARKAALKRLAKAK